MKKRGQVTLFVIIAIVIVAGAFLVLYTQTDILGQRAERIPEIAPIRAEIQNCLDQTAFDGITLAGLQGGYISLPNLTFTTNFSEIPYSYYEGRSLLLTLGGIEKEVSAYVSLMLPKCVDFSKWPDYAITPSNAISTTLIKNNLVKVDVKWPVIIKKADSTYRLEKFSTSIPIRLGMIHNITRTIVTGEIKEPNLIRADYFSDVYNEYNIRIDLLPFNTTLIYLITDPLSKFKNQPINYTFLFANKFK